MSNALDHHVLPGTRPAPKAGPAVFAWTPYGAWVLALSVLFVCGKFLPSGKLFAQPAHYLIAHNILEFVSMAVSAMVFAIALNLARHANNRHAVLLGAGFLAVCLVDLAHTLSFAGMPDLITPSGPEKAINFWLAGRYIAAAALLAAALIKEGTWSRFNCRLLVGGAVALSALIWWGGLFGAEALPRTFVPGHGLTPLKIRAEYLLAALYGVAAVLLYIRRGRSEYGDLQWLAAAAWVQGLAELFFTLYADVTDLFNLLGHIYKAIAYLMVYRALFVVWVQAPYRELEFERTRLRTLVSTIPDLVWLKDAQGIYLYCNKRFERFFGAPEEKIVGKTDFDFVDAELARFFRLHDLRAMEAGGPSVNEEWLNFADGSCQGLFETTKTPMLGADGKIIGVLGIAHDITLRKQNEDNLRIAAIAFESQEGLFITDQNRVILRVNRAFTDITGYGAEEVAGKTPDMLRASRNSASFFADVGEIIQRTGTWQGEVWYRRKNGEDYPAWLTVTAVRAEDGGVTHYVAGLVDNTERKRAEEEINNLAFYDPLTALPNRRLLLDRLKQWQVITARSERYGALLLIDLDNFKTLNDAHGHDIGDLLLKQAALRLGACVREGDTVARLGGDEFVVMLDGLSHQPQEAAALVETVGRKILVAMSTPFKLGNIEHRSSASIGATLFMGNRTAIEDLLKQADLAMYKSKETGRNALRFFDPAMQTIVLERVSLESALRKAIEHTQFMLHYQAQVVDGGHITGAEVLVRWLHPERGMVAPGEFIPLAEETGLILPLGVWVLQSACVQLAQWAKQPELAGLSIAVNVSAKQIREPDFADRVLAILNETGANPQRLKLELTESLFVDDVDDIIGKMYLLRARGVSFSLDDFGTGYSSLSYLRRLPLDQLKIDQSFVRDILIDPNDAAISKTIVALAETLGLSVIAEGVETEAQKDFLARQGCYAYQGYLFSRPIALPEFEAFVRGNPLVRKA